MALTYSTQQWIGKAAPDFTLPGVDGKNYSLNQFKDKKAVLVIFICNHCPYVIAVRDRLNQIAKDYADKGLQVIALNSNDASRYPEDSFEKMKEYALKYSFQYPYLFDETQKTARDYQAVCTPDPYLLESLNGEFILRYQGRLDDAWKDESQVTQKDLRAALDQVLAGHTVSGPQLPSMGCSIKWKN